MSMFDKEILKKIVIRQKLEFLTKQNFVQRDSLNEILKWLKDNRIIILTGIRRCGKSTLLKELMQNISNWCYVNFEDERFLDFKAQDFELLNEVLI